MDGTKSHVILFLDHHTRIITTDNPAPYEKMPHVLIDPDLSMVQGHPPHYWKKVGQNVIPIDNETKVLRDQMWKNLKWDEMELGRFVLKAHKEWQKKMRIRTTLMITLAALIPTLVFLWLR